MTEEALTERAATFAALRADAITNNMMDAAISYGWTLIHLNNEILVLRRQRLTA